MTQPTPPPAEPAGRLNILVLGEGGTFASPSRPQSHPQDVDDLFAQLRAQAAAHLVIYFHGGLTAEQDGLTQANQLMPFFGDRLGAYPLFFLWETGGGDIVAGTLQQIGQEPLFVRLRDIVIQFTLGKLQAPSATRDLSPPPGPDAVAQETARDRVAPDAPTVGGRPTLAPVDAVDAAQLQAHLQADPAYQAAVAQVQASLAPPADGTRDLLPTPAPAPPTLLSQDVQDALRAEDAAGTRDLGGGSLFLAGQAVAIFGRTVARLQAGTDHGVYCTVVEELLRALYADKIGTAYWDAVKARARDSFAPNDGLAGDALHGGRYLLERLAAYLAAADHPPLQVSLIGHSAGAIYVCHLLAAAHPLLPAGFQFAHVVFLAPAANLDLFTGTVLAHPEQIATFRMYALADAVEARDELAGPLYPRSLLYLVSGTFEAAPDTPLVGMARYYSGQPPYDTPPLQAARAYLLATTPPRAVWAVTTDAAPGYGSSAHHHMGFVFDPATQDSLAVLLAGAAQS